MTLFWPTTAESRPSHSPPPPSGPRLGGVPFGGAELPPAGTTNRCTAHLATNSSGLERSPAIHLGEQVMLVVTWRFVATSKLVPRAECEDNFQAQLGTPYCVETGIATVRLIAESGADYLLTGTLTGETRFGTVTLPVSSEGRVRFGK